MTKITAEKLNELREIAGNRYATAVFYSSLCHFFAWLTLLVVGVVAVASVIGSVRTSSGWGFVNALGCLGVGVLSFIGLKVAANLILAIVDLAVNSHLQVFLQNESE